jgi:hypothetical protein
MDENIHGAKLEQLKNYWIQNCTDVQRLHARYESEVPYIPQRRSRAGYVVRIPTIANWVPLPSAGPLSDLQIIIKEQGIRTRLRSYKKIKYHGVTFCTHRSEIRRVTESSGVQYKYKRASDDVECRAYGQILGIYRSVAYYHHNAPVKIILYIREVADEDLDMTDPSVSRPLLPFRKIHLINNLQNNMFISIDVIQPANMIFTPPDKTGQMYVLDRNLQWS